MFAANSISQISTAKIQRESASELASFSSSQGKNPPRTRTPRSARTGHSLPPSPASKSLLEKIGIGTPPRTVPATPHRTHHTRIPRTPRHEWKTLAHSYARHAKDFLPSVAKVSSLFQTPQRTAAIEARAAFKRIAPEVKNMLAHAADTLGQEPGYRKLSPRDRDGLLREKIAAAFVSELCVRQRLDGEDKAYAHAYFSLLLGVKAPEDSSEATQKLARYVSPAEQARGKQFLDLLVEDARSMGMNRTVDVELDLNQPKLQGFVSEQVRRAIIENGEMTTGMRGKPVNVSGTFWRDFTGGGATEYWLDDGQGVPERLSADTEAGALASTQRLLALIGKDDHDVAKLLTHVASQNVSTVAMAMVNQAFFEDRERFAPLRTPQGQPVAVCLSPNVKFTFRKLKDGKVELHYVGKMAPPKDIDSRIKNAAKVQDDAMGNWKLLESSDYSLKIDFRMVFEPNGEWTMGNPRIQARNMHRIAE